MFYFQPLYNEVRYYFAEDVDSKILEYFSLNTVSGVITLKKSVMLDEERTKEYGVSIACFCRPWPTQAYIAWEIAWKMFCVDLVWYY